MKQGIPLSAEVVQDICIRLDNGESPQNIAAIDGCTDCTVSRIGREYGIQPLRIRSGNPTNCRRCGVLLTIDNTKRRQYSNGGKRLAYDCKPCENENERRRKIRYKIECIIAYGGKCVCCGETIMEFLTIDHIFNDGAEDKKNYSGSGGHVWKYLRDLGYPKDRYQLMCFNCNCAKGHFGSCPHEMLYIPILASIQVSAK